MRCSSWMASQSSQLETWAWQLNNTSSAKLGSKGYKVNLHCQSKALQPKSAGSLLRFMIRIGARSRQWLSHEIEWALARSRTSWPRLFQQYHDQASLLWWKSHMFTLVRALSPVFLRSHTRQAAALVYLGFALVQAEGRFMLVWYMPSLAWLVWPQFGGSLN